MVQVKANESMKTAFGSIKERAEILDDDGTLLGYFEPVNEDVLYTKAASQIDPAEIRRRKLAGGVGFTIQEVKERLLA